MSEYTTLEIIIAALVGNTVGLYVLVLGLWFDIEERFVDWKYAPLRDEGPL